MTVRPRSSYVSGIGYHYIVHSPGFKFAPEFIFCVICRKNVFFYFYMKYYEYSIWDLGSRGFLGFFRDFRDLAEFSGISGIWDWDWDLIFKIWDQGLGLGFDFANLGSAIGIWDWF